MATPPRPRTRRTDPSARAHCWRHVHRRRRPVAAKGGTRFEVEEEDGLTFVSARNAACSVTLVLPPGAKAALLRAVADGSDVAEVLGGVEILVSLRSEPPS